MPERQMNILVIFSTPGPEWDASKERIRRRLSQHHLEFAHGLSQAGSYVPNAEIILCFFFADEYARKATRLKWIQALGTGVDRIIDLPSLGPDVVVTSTRGIHGPPVSEAALALMFSLSRNLSRCFRSQAERRWDPFVPTLIQNKTVGILGTGVIGQALALKCKALGMEVVGVTATPRSSPGFDRMRSRADLEQAAGEFDYFVLVTPLSDGTKSIVNAGILKAMKPAAFLINVGRGGLVDESALATALREGWIAGAGLDCFVHEPLPPESPLWSFPNVLVTPHMAGRHDGYIDDALNIFEANLAHYLAGQTEKMVNLIPRQPVTGSAREGRTGG
ncbi:MAG TPA: D-2-hydroxyacid dehydrogenase [Patescibacteria group bacterium]|nr:D-2-hydroxyacid dehydrogenase [Patescibacteria group bacterium]